jgi:non-ribosomal peptide synthetase component F
MATPTSVAASGDAATLTAFLLAAVTENPRKAAVVDGDITMTFAELWTQAHAQAAHLTNSGVQPGDAVGLFLEPGAGLITAVWGVLIAGAAYVPLAVDYPAERIRYMINHSKLENIITDERSGPLVRQLTPDTVRVHQAGNHAPSPVNPSADQCVSNPSWPAYVIFTSGSTGKPKGVAVPHRAISHQMRWLGSKMALGSARILLKRPTSFDAAQWELLANAAGGTIIIGPAGIHRNPTRSESRICNAFPLSGVHSSASRRSPPAARSPTFSAAVRR